jgi:4-amino-4-deoxy-L-arabinose transferase-like glycosyltransferase
VNPKAVESCAGPSQQMPSRTIQSPAMPQQRSMKPERNLWPIVAAIAVLVIVVAGTKWSFNHPYPLHWDEALDINEAQIDTQRLQHGMLVRLVGRLFIKSLGRPPAYRLIALPFLGVLGFQASTARFTSVACFALSALFLYLATRRIARPAASAFAVLIFALSPVVVSANIWFSTEGPLYLATSAMLYYLFVTWTEPSEKSSSWIGLGLAIGLGLLSKASFFAIVLPVVAFSFVAGLRRQFGTQSLALQRKAGLLALVVAMPWWLLNIKPAIAVAEQARGFVADSLGPPSIATWARWLSTVCQSLLGYGVSILICLVLGMWIYRAFVKKDSVLDPLQRAALWACACAGAPIVLIQLTGTNHLLRHISPAIIPLAITMGVLAGKVEWEGSGPLVVISSLAFGIQLLMILAPMFFPNNYALDSGGVNAPLPWRILTLREQWDWKPIFRISHDCGVESPTIAYVGMGPTFNPPQIEHPWFAAAGSTVNATSPYPDVHLLWRYGQGTPDWPTMMASVEQSDIALTAPHYGGDLMENHGLDNQYNAEFADRLSRDPRFQGPIRLEMGRFEPVEVQVFVRKSLPCHLPERVAAKP